MKILILGGTGFQGPHIVDEARKAKHTITLFNRGKTNPQLFPDIEKLRGDRSNDLKSLEGRQWDACIDTSGNVPRHVRDSASLLAKNGLKQYVYYSSVSAYADFKMEGLDETYPVGKIDDETVEKITETSYGPLKALSEKAAEKAMPGRTTVIRPGLIVGPCDFSDRFTYWPARLDRGGEVLAPAPPDAPVQYIDARDLARWTIQLVEDGHAGVFNALGPNYTLTFEELAHGCKCVAGKPASFTWIDEKFLLDHDVGPWMELPLWVPASEGAGFSKVSNARALAMGLTFRPPAETIKDTLEWHRKRPLDYKWRAGLKAEKEAKVLKAWHERGPSSQKATP